MGLKLGQGFLGLDVTPKICPRTSPHHLELWLVYLHSVWFPADKKVKSHLSKSEVMDGQVMVEQDPILSVSPLLSSTAGSVTPVRSPVSFETKEPCWPETRKVAMVATTGTIEKRQNGVNTFKDCKLFEKI